MAYWYSVYNNDEYEAEIQVGLYQRWLEQLDFGPTQADRVLVHTNMMEHAHERRFAVSEASLQMANFEMDHCRRIQQAVDHLQLRFTTNASPEIDDPEMDYDYVLIGLAPPSRKATHHDCSQFDIAEGREDNIPIRSALQNMLWQNHLVTTLTQSERSGDDLMIDVSEALDEVDDKQDLCKDFLEMRKQGHHAMSSRSTRQRKHIRRRIAPIHASKGGEKDGIVRGSTALGSQLESRPIKE